MKTNRQKFNDQHQIAEDAHLDLEQLAQLSSIPVGCLRQVLARGSSKSGTNDPFNPKKKNKKITPLPPQVGVGAGYSRVYSFLMRTRAVYGGSEADLVLLYGLPPLEKPQPKKGRSARQVSQPSPSQSDDETPPEYLEELEERPPAAFRRHLLYISEDRDQSSSPHEEEPTQCSESGRAEHIELKPSDDPQPVLRTHSTILQYLEQTRLGTQHLEPGTQPEVSPQICSQTPQSKNRRQKKAQ